MLVSEPDIKWDAELYFRHVEVALVAEEPKKDYVVDIPMGKTQVSGESSGIEILGYFTIGASETAEGVDVSSRSDNILGNALSLLAPLKEPSRFQVELL